MTGSAVPGKTRRYHAPQRAEGARRTRAAVVSAALELFRTQGYVATSMRQIALTAGVSVPTVEAAFGTKAALLDVVVDQTTAGDDLQVPMLQRPAAQREHPDAASFLAGAAAQIAEVADRVAGLFAAVDAARHTDPDVRRLAERLQRQRVVLAEWVVDRLDGYRATARDLDRDQAVQSALVLLDPAVHRRLLVDAGWSVPRFEHWMVRALTHLLTDQ